MMESDFMVIYTEKRDTRWVIVEWIITLLINAFAIVLATKIFKGFYVQSYWEAVITSIVIMLLNKTVKPILKTLTLPITIFSLGLLYPIVDTIILKIASWIMGSAFVVEGWLVPFFVSIFISIVTVLLDVIITKSIIRSSL
jgi:putative membrane protein